MENKLPQLNAKQDKPEHYKKLFNPNYIGSWDLLVGEDANGKPIYNDITVEIKSIDVEDIIIGGKSLPSSKLIRFVGAKKPFLVKAENAKRIAKVLGTPIYKNWIGKKITLTVLPIAAFDSNYDAVRVKYVKNNEH